MGVAASAWAALREPDRAKAWMSRALMIDPDNMLMRYNFACDLATSLDDAEAALDMLGPVLEQDPGANVIHANLDPDLASLRDHPRFQAMLATAEARLAKAGGA